MEFEVKEKYQGASVELTCTIYSPNSNSYGESHLVNIIDNVGVRISYIHKDQYNIIAKFLFPKVIGSSVRLKVISEDLYYHAERTCSDQEYWEEMGLKYISMAPKNHGYIFVFVVTVFAYVAETTALERLYKDADFTDFRLSTTEGSVPVHKACLVSHSDVFKKMLSREWKETGEGSMQLPGVTLQILQDLKQYLYLGTLPKEGFLPLLGLASCYMLEDLKEMCLSKLAWNVKPEDFCSLLQYSMDHNIPELTFALIQTTPKGVIENARKINVKKMLMTKQGHNDS